MKRTTHIILAGMIAAGFSAASRADDDGARFESSGFLKSLDAFIAEQMARQKDGAKVSAAGHLKELELSLRAKPDENKDYFRLSDSPESPNFSLNGTSSTSDFRSILSPTGQLRSAAGFDELASNSQLKLAFGSDEAIRDSKAFEISLKSGYRISTDSLPAPSAFADTGLADREYNLGVTLGYSGFGVDASLTRQTSVFKPESFGFDVGLSYQTTKFAARLSMSEYREGADLYGIENDVRSIVSVELGARYKLSDSIGLNGGVRYYDYGDQWVVDPEAGENSKMIFLGGQLKF